QRAQVGHNPQVDLKARVCDANVYSIRIINYPKELFGRRKVIEPELDDGAAWRGFIPLYVLVHIPHLENCIQFAAAEVAARPSLAPLAKSEDDWFELLAGSGQAILQSLSCVRTAPFNYTRFFKGLQSIGQDGWRQERNTATKIIKACAAED